MVGDRERGQLGEMVLNNGLHGRGNHELDALFEKGPDGPYPLRHITEDLFVVERTTRNGAYLLLMFRQRHVCLGVHLSCFRHDAGERDG